MISFQDIIDKTVAQRKAIRQRLQETSKNVGWCPSEPIEGTKGTMFEPSLYDDLKKADAYEIKQTLDAMTLSEVLVKGSSAMGGDDIIAAKVHDTLISASKETDICGLIGRVTGAWEGANLTVPIRKDGTYVPKKTTAIAKAADAGGAFTYATLAPTTYTLPVVVGSDFVEDQAYALAEMAVRDAGKACGELASVLALTVLKAPPDGDGTANSEAGAADETNWVDIQNAIEANGRDEFISDTMIITHEAWTHSVAHGTEIAGGAGGDFGVYPAVELSPLAPGFHFKFDGNLDSLFCNLSPLHAAMPGTDTPGGAMTNCITLVFDRDNALLTGRKRWLEIRDYANPVEDLEGAVVSFRQDSVTLYKDSICVITEA